MKATLFLLWLFPLAVGAEFRAAIAVRVVTPERLLPVSGGVGPSHPVHKKEGDLTVRALVFADDRSRVAIVGADFLGFPSVLANKVRAKVTGIPAENILIGATHTHSAPDSYGFPDGKGGFAIDLKYIDSVCTQMGEAINEAAGKLQPARLKIATGEAKGKIAYNYYAPQLYDPRCSVIQALGADGKPFATLVNYAIHPEVLGARAGILSPDLIGPLYDRIAAKGGGVAIFMNGAQGGMVTADNREPEGKESRTWPECVRIGELLADEALRIIASASSQVNPQLFCAAKTISFPVDSPALRAVMMSSPLGYPTNDATPAYGVPALAGPSSAKAKEILPAEAGTPYTRVKTQLNLINIGNAQILTIPGEALPNIGYYLKRKMRGEHNLLFGLTNDAFGYILTKVDWGSFKRYDYVSRTCLGEMTGEIYIDEALRFVAQCPPADPVRR